MSILLGESCVSARSNKRVQIIDLSEIGASSRPVTETANVDVMAMASLIQRGGSIYPTKPLNKRNSLQIIDLEVLCLLRLQPMSGYELKKHLMQTFDYNISFGTLYPHLRSLEASRLILGRWIPKKPRKRLYSITDRGRERLTLSSRQLSLLLQLIMSSEEK